jgi:hypothetical protein
MRFSKANSLGGGFSVRKRPRTISVLMSITVLILVGIIVDQPNEVFSQSREVGLSREIRTDPFLLPPGIRLLSASELVLGPKERASRTEEKPSDLLPPWTLRAILISSGVRLALIDRQIVSVGDSIKEEKVLEIEKDRVVLGKKDGKRTLLLPQSPVRVKVEEK